MRLSFCVRGQMDVVMAINRVLSMFPYINGKTKYEDVVGTPDSVLTAKDLLVDDKCYDDLFYCFIDAYEISGYFYLYGKFGEVKFAFSPKEIIY